MTGMIIVFEVRLSFLTGRLVSVMAKKSNYYSNLPPQTLEFEVLRGFGLHLSNEIVFVMSLDV